MPRSMVTEAPFLPVTSFPARSCHLHSTEHRTRGSSPAAALLLIERGKRGLGRPATINTSSVAVLERVGMGREGHLLESTWSKGEWTNDLLYAVLRREWPTSS
jgi:RimJ/RimL family protein N-acetyltransferase